MADPVGDVPRQPLLVTRGARRFSFSDESDECVYVVVLTGGPGGGKSTAMAVIADRLKSFGFQVFSCPEIPTLLHMASCGYPVHGTAKQRLYWEGQKMAVQIALEDAMVAIAKNQKRPTVVLCDRSAQDSAAYVSQEDYNYILEENGWTRALLLNRANCVVHLITAADGALEYYTTENNAARRENPQHACETDQQLLKAWADHKNVVVIDNSTGFNVKVDRAADAICESLGIESHSVGKQVFLLLQCNVTCDLVAMVPTREVVMCDIKVTFLKGAKDEPIDSLVRSRTTEGGSTSFALSIASLLSSGERVYQESALSPADAGRLIKTQCDASLRPLHRRRITFLYDARAMMLDVCQGGVLLLRVERLPGAAPVSPESLVMPPWLSAHAEVIREVTGDPTFVYKAMAVPTAVSS